MVRNGLDEMKSALTEATGLVYRMLLCVQGWSTGVDLLGGKVECVMGGAGWFGDREGGFWKR